MGRILKYMLNYFGMLANSIKFRRFQMERNNFKKNDREHTSKDVNITSGDLKGSQ